MSPLLALLCVEGNFGTVPRKNLNEKIKSWLACDPRPSLLSLLTPQLSHRLACSCLNSKPLLLLLFLLLLVYCHLAPADHVPPRSPEKTQHLKPKLAQSGSWKDSTYRQCLYLQLECMEQELQLVGPRGFPKHHSHAQALRQLQTLKSCLRGQPGLLPPACAR
jgi:hypothetical protein